LALGDQKWDTSNHFMSQMGVETAFYVVYSTTMQGSNFSN